MLKASIFGSREQSFLGSIPGYISSQRVAVPLFERQWIFGSFPMEIARKHEQSYCSEPGGQPFRSNPVSGSNREVEETELALFGELQH